MLLPSASVHLNKYNNERFIAYKLTGYFEELVMKIFTVMPVVYLQNFAES